MLIARPADKTTLRASESTNSVANRQKLHKHTKGHDINLRPDAASLVLIFWCKTLIDLIIKFFCTFTGSERVAGGSEMTINTCKNSRAVPRNPYSNILQFFFVTSVSISS